MNRSIVYIGIALIGLGFALVAYPIAFTGAEQLDIEQELGFLVAPVGLVVVMLGALAQDPTRTTVGGAFGNPYAELERSKRAPAVEPRARRVFNPHEPADCRYCRTVITSDLAQCPRCARARECRNCGRPLGMVNDRVTCPTCGRIEGLCNCPLLVHSTPPVRPNVPPSRRR
jgi:RNA polymerase subunit RPABC4/transcription elongation factor Spt4